MGPEVRELKYQKKLLRAAAGHIAVRGLSPYVRPLFGNNKFVLKMKRCAPDREGDSKSSAAKTQSTEGHQPPGKSSADTKRRLSYDSGAFPFLLQGDAGCGGAAKESQHKTEESSIHSNSSRGKQRTESIGSSDVPAAAFNSSTSDGPKNAARKPILGLDYSNVSYPSPKNFAERFMGVLESGVASDLVWWVGDGKAVALHSKKLKNFSLLELYFRCKSYSALIRNFNRWYVSIVPLVSRSS